MPRIAVFTFLIPVLFAAVLSSSSHAARVREATLRVGETIYSGSYTADGGVEFFLGVPFAQAPVGELRWQPPQAIATEFAAAQATQFAAACQQGPHMVNWYRGVMVSFGGDPATFPEPTVSEDCLYLNIWKPAAPAPAKLPVVVYIHGGSNKGGWAYEPNYIGDNLARQGLVVISIAYRLGVFGFFAHPELENANFALLDQIAALQWVRHNVVAAGGDPDNITVMGESAGASNISYLLASPAAAGLFQRMIHESAGWAVMGRTSHEAHLARGVELQERLLGTEASLEKLRRIPADEVLQAAESVYAGHFFDPVIDGQSLVSPLKAILQQQTLPAVDLLIGSNAHEWLMYLEKDQTIDDWMLENLAPTQIAAAKSVLRADEHRDPYRAMDKLITAYNYVCPSMYLADQLSRGQGRSWFYYFSRVREGDLAQTMGAYHGAELPYVFNTHDDWLPTNQIDRDLTQSMMAYWANFARSGDPNGAHLPIWPPFNRATGTVLQLDKEIGTRVHDSLALCNVLMPAAL